MICKDVLFEPLTEEIDVEKLWNVLRGISKIYGVSVEIAFNTKRKTVRIRVCGLRSRVALTFLRNISEGLGLQEVRRRKKGSLSVKGLLKVIISDEVCLGNECKSGVPVCVERKKFLSHTLVVGSTGTGKTTTTIYIISALKEVKRLRVVILDWHGEYAEKLKGVTLEPCIPRYIKSDETNILVDAIVSSTELSATQHYLLMKVVNQLAAERERISLDDVIYKLKSIEESTRWVKESKYAILRRLEQLYSNMKTCKQDYLDSKVVIVDLSNMQDTFIKTYISNFILAWLRVVNRRLKKIKTIVVVEEAHNVAPRSREGETILDAIVREERKWGLYAYMVTQSPTSISREIIKNTQVKIIHGIREVDDAKFIAQSVGEEKLWKDLIRLNRGQFFISVASKPICVELHLLSNSSTRSNQLTFSR